MRAEDEYARGFYDLAEEEYRAALQLAPDPKAISELGILYSEEGRTLEAFPYLEKAAELGPERVKVRVRLGLANLALNAPKAARASAQRALADDPVSEEALVLLVDSGRSRKDDDQARQIIESLGRNHPDCAGYHLALGKLLLARGDQSGAESELKTSIQLDPKSAAAYLELGNLSALRRDAQNAGTAFQTAAGLAPLRSSARLRYIEFLFATGRPEDAKRELEN